MSIKKFINSFKYAFSGIKKVAKEEQNFRFHLFATLVVLFLSVFIFNFSYIELAITIMCIFIVLTTEIINTAIENTWNHLEPNHHPVVKSVKDMMAGAVFVSSLGAAVIWVLLILK